ncbi:TPA: hypothetical protein DCX15_03335 [bacterium]|nr:hypothetical protein [bacterium]
MGLFGQSESNFDRERRRLVIPSKFRYLLGDKCVITKGFNRLLIFRPDDWENMCHKIEEDIQDEVDRELILHRYYANAEMVNIDRQNRIVIPERLTAQLELGQEVIIVGYRDRMEVWRKEAWEEFDKKISRRLDEEYKEKLANRGISLEF